VFDPCNSEPLSDHEAAVFCLKINALDYSKAPRSPERTAKVLIFCDF